ncbi:MAG TPA: alkaline phosphatase family protein, partial [Vicinamibacteria bacterium]|nr:alkaline phosphatase family protein [Vicinamibacteria bacterium]
GAASAASASWHAALRLGLLGGVVFGLATTLGAALFDERLRRSPQDLVILAAYLVVALGLATAVAAFLGGLAAAWWGRRGGPQAHPALARNVGLALALGALAYHALWWRSHAMQAPLGLQVLAALLGVAISVILGRFGTLAAVAVLAAGGLADRLPQASLSRRRMLPLLAAAALLFGAGVAAASYFGERDARVAPDFAVVPTGLRVVLLGIDGLDAGLADKLVAQGEMKHLAALRARAARGRLRVEPEQVPAIVWTTIATGRGPEAHGIQSMGGRRLAGMRTPIALGEEGPFARAMGRATDLFRLTRSQPPSSVLRSAKALWNVASEKGLRVGVVNWWATWPADPVNGYVVTDRAFFKLEKGGPPEREVHPPEAMAALQALPRSAEADRARALDRFPLEAARALAGATPPDLEALYLPGLDIVTMQQLGQAAAADVAGLDARLASVRAHYAFVDSLVGQVVDALGPRDLLVLVADPGRLPRTGPTPPSGELLLAGEPVLAGDLGEVGERDVAPTVLHLLGLPRSREMDGRVLESALTPAFRAAHPVRAVDSYGSRAAGRPTESRFDEEMLEELRALGYIH